MTRLLLICALLCSPAWATRVFMSGCETNSGTTTMTDFAAINTGMSFSATNPHSGTYVCRMAASAGTPYVSVTQAADTTSGRTYYHRFYMKIPTALPAGTYDLYNALSSGGVSNFKLSLNSSGQIILTNGPDSGTCTITTALSAGATNWYRVEVRHKVSATVGEEEVRLYQGTDAGTLIDSCQYGAVNKNTLNTNVGVFRLGVLTSATWTVDYDDWAVQHDGATPLNSWAGEGKIALLTPAVDTTLAWKSSANCAGSVGTSTFANVDDLPGTPNETDYNCTTVSGATDAFTVATLPAEIPSTAVIISAQVEARVAGTSATGTNTLSMVIGGAGITGATGTAFAGCDQNAVYNSNGITLPADELTVNMQTACSGGQCTKAQAQNLTLGYAAATLGGSSTCQIRALWGYLEWKPAAAAPTSIPRLTMLGVGQ